MKIVQNGGSLLQELLSLLLVRAALLSRIAKHRTVLPGRIAKYRVLLPIVGITKD